jgi:hypothetical protein
MDYFPIASDVLVGNSTTGYSSQLCSAWCCTTNGPLVLSNSRVVQPVNHADI